MRWLCGTKTLEIKRPLVMGIVNVTPDSFSDGGTHTSVSEAIAFGERLLAEGADILDIGGESTRPGAAYVSEEEEVARVIPVVRELLKTGAVISVDTSKSEVMKAAIDEGAHIINDVCALTKPGALSVVADSQVGVCLMHMKGTPEDMQKKTDYADVTSDVESYLLERARVCEQAGIARERICLDYGFGFAKTVDQNFELLAHTDRFAHLPYPILVGLSRKSSLGAITGRDVNHRSYASVAGALIAAQKGASIVRVHDVAATVDAFKIWLKTESSR